MKSILTFAPIASLLSRRRKLRLEILLFSLPAGLLFFTFYVLPIIQSFINSFFDWDGFHAVTGADFVGLKNYIRIFRDKTAQASFLNTIHYTIIVSILQNVIGLGLALLVNSKIFARNLNRVLFFIPCLLSSVVVSFTWMKIYDPYSGVLNLMLQQIGLDSLTQNWLGNADLALYAIMATAIWQWSGYYMVIYLAGLQGIDANLLEAAMIDGAGSWNRFWRIIFPMLAPSLTVCAILSTVNGFKVFDSVYMMTSGGPGYATEVIMSQIFYQAYRFDQNGYSCALSVVLFFIIMVISLAQLRFLNRREDALQ